MNNPDIDDFYFKQSEIISKIGMYQFIANKNQLIGVSEGIYNIFEWNDISDIQDITSFLNKDDKNLFMYKLEELFANPDKISNELKHIIILKNSKKKYVSHTLKIIKNNQDDFVILGLVQDITERYNFEREISKKAYYDLLTSLPNRAGFEKSFNKSMMLAKDVHNLALLFIDLDDFKKINDTMGHNVGDKLLRHITAMIQTTAEKYKDIYSDNDYIFSKITPARFGGDEFIISFPYNDDFSIVETFTKELIQVINKSISIKGSKVKPSVSIGISRFPQDGENFMTLLKKSDLAMYQAKNNHKNTYSIYNTKLGESATNKLKTESELFDALKDNQLVLHYQPKINLFTGQVNCYESLIRWNHPTKGLLYPGSFIQVAEESDLIYEVTDWVIEQCLKDYLKFFKQYEGRIAINLSAKQFNSNLLSHKIFSLSSDKIDPAKFEFEITEGVLIDNVDQTINMLKIIKNKGFKCAIDDFGSGYSSFNYIKELPIDTLKLDKIFIDHIENHKDKAIIKSVVFLAHELGLDLVSEGIETQQQLDFLLDVKCTYAQGFYISKGLSIEDLQTPSYKNQVDQVGRYIKMYHQTQLKNKQSKIGG